MGAKIDVNSPTTGSVLYTIADDDLLLPIPVHENDLIAALESCKMEIGIRAPMGGNCIFFVIPGEIVNEGMRLAQIEVAL